MNTKEKLTFAVEIGETMLKNGGEVYRVEETILRILHTLNIIECDVYVLSNGIFASAHESKEDACSIIRNCTLGAMNLGKVAQLNQLSRQLEAGVIDEQQALKILEEVKKKEDIPILFLMIACGLGCGSFTYIFGGTVLDAFFSFIVGFILEVFLSRKMQSKFIKQIFGSAMVTLCAIPLSKLIFKNLNTDKIIIGCIMPLVPGIAFTTAIRDLFHGDYLSGTIHLLDAILTGLCIAAGVGSMMMLWRAL